MHSPDRNSLPPLPADQCAEDHLLLWADPGYVEPEAIHRSLHKRVSGDFGRVRLIGHCLETQEEIARAGQQAANGDIQPLTNLAGNFSGILITPDTAIAFGSLSNQFPLYYSRHGEKIRVHHSPSFIAEMQSAELDRATLAAQIGLPMGLLRETYSSFQGVRKLNAGQMLCIDRQGLCNNDAYETFAPAPDGSLEKASHATREALEEALTKRLDQYSVSADFSGLDSSSLACKAASLGSQVMPVMTHHHPGYSTGDIEFARELADPHPLLELHEVEETDNELPFSVLSPRDLPFDPDEPFRNASLYGRLRRRASAIESLRKKDWQPNLHLTGTAGDALYNSEIFLADLLMEGDGSARPDQFLEDGIRIARLQLGTPAAYMQQARIHASLTLAQAWNRLAEVLGDPSKRGAFDVGWLPTLNRNLDWLTPEMRRLLQERAMATAKEAQTDMRIGDYRTISQICDSGDAQRHFGDKLGVHAPYLDHRVIRAALQCTAYERSQAGRQFKAALRRALSGHGVPETLFERRTKGDYSLLVASGLRNAQARLQLLLQNSRLALLGVIDPKAVLNALYNHEHDGKGPADFGQFAAVEIWLRQREIKLGEYIGSPPFSVAPSGETMLSKPAVPTNRVNCAAGPGEQMAIMDVFTGEMGFLDKTDSIILRALNETGDPGYATWQLTERYPNIAADSLSLEVAKRIKRMIEQGWLTQDVEKNGRLPILKSVLIDEWSPYRGVQFMDLFTGHTKRELIDDRPPTEQEMQIGRAVLHTACDLNNKKDLFAVRSHIIGIQEPLSQQLGYDEACRFQSIIRRISYEPAYQNQRVACYELSLATVSMAAAHKYILPWVIGVAFETQPVVHAWAESDHLPVVTRNDEHIRGRFQRLLRVQGGTYP